MSGTAVRLGRLTALWLLAAALAPVGWISIAAASTVQETTLRPPTLLWKSYPLEPPPSTIDPAHAGPGSLWTQWQPSPEATRQAAQPGSPEVQPLRDLLIVSALLASLVGMAAILLMQSSVPARVGGFRRARNGAGIRELARRPSDPMPPRKTRPPRREVTGQPVADPHAQPAQPAVPEPDDDLVEALHPTSPSAPELEPVPEQAVERLDGAPGKGVARFEGIAFWSLAVVAVGMILFVGGLAFGVVPVAEPGADQATQAASPQAESSALTTAAPVATTTAPVAATTAGAPLVVIRAVGGECWVVAREGSADGRVLYVGLLARGQVKRLTARQVWLRLGAGQNVVVTAGGRRAPVPPGTGDMVVRA